MNIEYVKKAMSKLFTKEELEKVDNFVELINEMEEVLYTYQSAKEYYLEDHPFLVNIDEFIDWENLIKDYEFDVVIDDEDKHKRIYVDNVEFREMRRRLGI